MVNNKTERDLTILKHPLGLVRERNSYLSHELAVPVGFLSMQLSLTLSNVSYERRVPATREQHV